MADIFDGFFLIYFSTVWMMGWFSRALEARKIGFVFFNSLFFSCSANSRDVKQEKLAIKLTKVLVN